MGTRWLITASVAIAVSLAASTARAAAPARHGATAVATVTSGRADERPSASCELPRLRASRLSPARPQSPPAAAPEPTAPRAEGGLEVAIPPVVFIRVRPHFLVVTTNTGEPPRPDDAFWVLGPRRATPADASTRAEVLARCTSWTSR